MELETNLRKGNVMGSVINGICFISFTVRLFVVYDGLTCNYVNIRLYCVSD